MAEVKQQIEMLRREGHHDAAKLLEQYSSSVNSEAEFRYLLDFARRADFFFRAQRVQLRSLWTAYCFHANMDVDTRAYDRDLRLVWDALPANHEEDSGDGFTTFEKFDDFMCVVLV